MLRSSHAHSLLLLALLTPVLGCGDDTSKNGGSGGSGSGELIPSSGYTTEEVDVCLERERLWRDVLATEASTTAATTGPVSASVAGSGGAGGGAGGAGGAGGGAPGGQGGDGGGLPDGCPDAERAEDIVNESEGVESYETSQVEALGQSGEECCYHLTHTYGAAGRPVRVDDEVVVAAIRRDGAQGSSAPRAAVAHWEWVARLEHASVASFALLSIDLMAHGAPLDLVADSQRASLDEVRHAEMMFAHASRLGGSHVEAGDMLALTSSRLSPDVDALVAATVRDGCVNETFASFEAAEQAARCDDAALARDLGVIAVDEAGHAALGWRIVAWALQAKRTTPEHVAACLRDAIASLRSSGSGPSSASLERYGLLSGATREALVSEVGARLEAVGARVLARSEMFQAA